MVTFPVVAQPQTKLATPIHDISNPPLAICVKNAYLCGNYKHIAANSGDRVIVFAWTSNRTEAIAYNPRNKTAGRISIDVLKKEDSEQFTDTTLYMTAPNESSSSLDNVNWRAGDCVRT